jgi:hypothetical protein
MQVKEMHKMMRAHSGAFLLPGIAAAFLVTLQGATYKELQEWKISKWLDMRSFVTGGNFLLAPVGIQTLHAIQTVLEGKANQKVRCRSTL